MALYSKATVKSDSNNPAQFLAAKIEEATLGYDTAAICEALQIVRKAVMGFVVPTEPSTQHSKPSPIPIPYDWKKTVVDKSRVK
jgi:hypothetical protein